EAEDGGPPIVFETDAAIHAVTAPLQFVMVSDGFTVTEVKQSNNALAAYLPFGSAARLDSALYLGFAYATGYAGPDEFPKLDLDLSVTVSPEQSLAPSMFRCTGGRTREYPSAQIVWESWNGSIWQKLDRIKDET